MTDALTATETIEPIEHGALRKGIRVPPEDFELWLEKLDWTWHQLARKEFPSVKFRHYYGQRIKLPRPYLSLEEFQYACIANDPVLWCEGFLRHPKNPKLPWRFWDYQKPSIRHFGNVLHEDGAEVGKSREIIGYALCEMFTNAYGSGLVVAPLFTHVLKLALSCVRQIKQNPILSPALKAHVKYPQHSIELSNGFETFFLPAGYDGENIRSVHVETFSMIDEAAKLKNPDIYKEYWRAAEPSCVHRIYSTPDGNRSTVFYRLCQRAEGKEEIKKNVDEEDALEDSLGGDIAWKKFHWSKELMPPPFWTPERRRFYVKEYGGEDSPGYQQNVLGNWGDPENSVFPWYSFARLLRDIPEYRVLKILVDDSQDEVSIFGAKYAPQPGGGDGNTGARRETKPEEVILADHRLPKHGFDIRQEIKSFFSNIPGLKFGGGDLGFSRDPTEIYVKLIMGKTHRLAARLQMKGVTYDQQCEAIDALDDVFDAGEKRMGWGFDFGNAGSAVVQMLQASAEGSNAASASAASRYYDKRYEDRLFGYLFGETYEAVNEDGELLMDRHTEKPIKLTAKELSSDLLVKKMQRLELEYPYDPDIILMYPNHTYREGDKHRIYKKEDDHVIDADRAVTLRVILPGAEREDEFACGSKLR